LTMKDVPIAICFTIIGFLCFHHLKKVEVGIRDQLTFGYLNLNVKLLAGAKSDSLCAKDRVEPECELAKLFVLINKRVCMNQNGCSIVPFR